MEAESASAALGAEGVRVDFAKDAREVLHSVAERRPGGIVLDDGLSGISGSALCQVLRRRPETRQSWDPVWISGLSLPPGRDFPRRSWDCC